MSVISCYLQTPSCDSHLYNLSLKPLLPGASLNLGRLQQAEKPSYLTLTGKEASGTGKQLKSILVWQQKVCASPRTQTYS